MTSISISSARTQGLLWGTAPDVWAETEERKCAPLFDDVLDALAPAPGSRLLDAGCGAGLAVHRAVSRGVVTTGLDASEAMIAFARTRTTQARFDVGDIQALPYEDDSFDAVIAVNSVFYCADMGVAMAELARVVRPGGKLALTAWGRPDRCEMAGVFAALVGTLSAPPPGPGPFGLSEPGALEGLLEAAGLQPVGDGTTRCLFEAPNWASCWRGMWSAGPMQAVAKVVGAERAEAAARGATVPFTDEVGVIRMYNDFRWVVGQKPGRTA